MADKPTLEIVITEKLAAAGQGFVTPTGAPPPPNQPSPRANIPPPSPGGLSSARLGGVPPIQPGRKALNAVLGNLIQQSLGAVGRFGGRGVGQVAQSAVGAVGGVGKAGTAVGTAISGGAAGSALVTAGIIGAAVGGLILLGVATTKVTKLFLKMTDRIDNLLLPLRSFSLEVARAAAEREIVGLQIQLRRAGKVERESADFIRSKTEFKQTIQDALTDVLGPILPLFTQAQRSLTDVVSAVGELLEFMARVVKPFVDIAIIYMQFKTAKARFIDFVMKKINRWFSDEAGKENELAIDIEGLLQAKGLDNPDDRRFKPRGIPFRQK